MKKDEQTHFPPISDIPATMQAVVASDRGFEHVRLREVPGSCSRAWMPQVCVRAI